MNLKSTLETVLSKSDIARAYSGRSMMGKECLAFVAGDVGDVVSEILSVLVDEADPEQLGRLTEELSRYFAGFRTDSMGRGIVGYFPSLQYIDPN